MPAIDKHFSHNAGPSGPARTLFAITPHATNELPYVTSGLYVGGAGDISIQDLTTGAWVLFKAVPAGTLLPICTKVIRPSGTTATNIVGLA